MFTLTLTIHHLFEVLYHLNSRSFILLITQKNSSRLLNMASAYAPPYERCTDCKERAGVTVQVKGLTKESKTGILRLSRRKFNQFSSFLNQQQ